MALRRTDPDAYLRTGRISVFLAIVLAVVGAILVAWGTEPGKPFWKDIMTQVGFAAITASILDLVFHEAVGRWKRALAAPFTTLAEKIDGSDAKWDRFFASVDEKIKEAQETAFRMELEDRLESIMAQLEEIRVAVNPTDRGPRKQEDDGEE